MSHRSLCTYNTAPDVPPLIYAEANIFERTSPQFFPINLIGWGICKSAANCEWKNIFEYHYWCTRLVLNVRRTVPQRAQSFTILLQLAPVPLSILKAYVQLTKSAALPHDVPSNLATLTVHNEVLHFAYIYLQYCTLPEIFTTVSQVLPDLGLVLSKMQNHPRQKQN